MLLLLASRGYNNHETMGRIAAKEAQDARKEADLKADQAANIYDAVKNL